MSPVCVESGSVLVFGFWGKAKMAQSVARGSTWKWKSDFPLRTAAVGCNLSVGPQVQSGNSG